MFQAFEPSVDLNGPRRALAAFGLAAVLVLGAGFGAATLPKSAPAAKKAKAVPVAFRPPPPVEQPAPKPQPPPPPPKVVTPKPVAAAAAPAAPAPIVIPTVTPTAPPPEASAENAVAAKVFAVGGTGTGEAAPAAEPDEAPVAAAPPGAPVVLPEDAEPPEELDDNVRPEFPESAIAKGTEGLVVLRIVVELDGQVGRIQVMKGEEPFIAAAIAAVRGWKYSPARLDGAPLAVFRIVKIPFLLKRTP